MAVGRFAFSVRTFCICKLIIMNDASRKNMMSISGMISSRDCFCGNGRADFHWCGWISAAADHERDFLDARAADGFDSTFTMSPCNVSRSPLI